MSVKSSTRSLKKRKIREKKVNVDTLYQNKDVITIQEKMLDEIKKEVPMEEEKVAPLSLVQEGPPDYWTIASPVSFSQIPSGDNDCWQSTSEGKTQHYDPMPLAAFNEDLSQNQAIQEWALNHLPLQQEQKKTMIDELNKLNGMDYAYDRDYDPIKQSMIYQKPSLTRHTYDKLKKEKKSEKPRGLRTGVKNKDHEFTFSKTVLTCQAKESSGDSSTTMEVHLVRPTRTPLKTL